jgi:hypothetical protein
MRKLVTWALVSLGVAALARRLRRRRGATATVPAPTALRPSTDPAEELRRKLAESRTASGEPETTPETAVADRRAQVHEEGRAALDEMQARAGE